MKKFSLLSAILLLCLACGGPSGEDAADFVFTNGKVYTVDESHPWAEAVAVKGDKIVYVGDDAGASAFVGSATETTDLNGRMMLPGFVSGHDHLIGSNWTKAGVNLFAAESKEDYLRMIKEYADANPDAEILVGYGWEKGKYGGFPTAKELDAIVSNRPAVFFDYTIHDLWLNSKALEMAKITKDTPDPQPGFSYWRRDAAGNPEGVAIEVSWLQAYIDIGAWKPETMLPESRKILYQKAAEAGLTAVMNAGLVTPNLANQPEAFKDQKAALELLDELDAKGDLELRTFVYMIYKKATGDVGELVQGTLELREQHDSDRVRVAGIKIHPEGNWMTKTSLQVEPFLDGDSGNVGIPGDKVKEVILAGNAAGLDVITHVDGSATVRATVDAIEASRQAGHTDARNTLQHYHLVQPDDHARVIAMELPINVTPVFTTDWSNTDALAINMLGEERAAAEMNEYPDAVRRGLKVSLSADIPSSPVDMIGPLLSMEAAMTLQSPNDEGSKTFPPGKQGLTLEQAIQGVTIFPAWQARMEDKIGSLEIGKFADLVVLEKNLFDVDPKDIADVEVVATMMGGRYTYQAE